MKTINKNQLIRRITAATLTLMFLMSLWIVPSEAAQDLYTPSDMKRFEENTELLIGLGIADDGRKAATTITRGEFAAIMLKYLGYADDTFTGSDKMYTDVPDKTSPVYGMSQLGFLNGYEDGSYRPENNITYAQVIKVFVTALGYEMPAANYGGYPGGYISCAQNIGLLKSVYASNDDTITYFMLSQMMVNALTINTLRKDNTGVYENDDTTWLKSRFDTEKYKGVVTAAQNISLSESGVEKKNTVTIDGTVYDVDHDCSSLIGCTVEYYVNGDNKVLCILEKNTNRIEIAADDILEYSGKAYQIDMGSGKKKKYTLDQSCYIVYNGSPAEHLTEEDMCPKYGKITLVDNGNDNKYDVVIIESYRLYYVNTIDRENKKIYYKNSSGNFLDFNGMSEEDMIVKNAEGMEATFDDIPANSVIRVKSNENNTKTEIIYSTKTVRGTITSMSQDKRYYEVGIDGTQYKLADDLADRSEMYMGRTGVFTLDSENFIGNVSSEDTAYSYGYLITTYESETDGKMMLKVFGSDGENAVYPLAGKTEVDGNRGQQPENAVKFLQKGDSVRQIIRFKCNAKGEITLIDTSYNSASDLSAAPGANEDENSLRIIYSGTTRYLSQMHNFAGKFNAGADTMVFVITGTQKKDYVVKRVSEIPNDTEFTMQAYSDDDSQFYAKIIFTEDKAIKGGGGDETFGVIADVTDAINEDLDVKKNISFRSKYLSRDFFMEEDLANPYPYNTADEPQYKVEPGDIVSIKYSGDTADEVALIYDRSENFFPAGSAYQYIRAHYHYIYGTVYSVEKGYINVTWKNVAQYGPPTIDEIEAFSIVDFVSMYKVSTIGNGKTTVEKASASDIVDYKTAGESCSKVFIAQEWEYPNLLVIYN